MPAQKQVAQLPQQERMFVRPDERWTIKGRWRIPQDAKQFRNGIDWETWQRSARPPATYDPPQLRPGWLGRCRNVSCINWYLRRSPFCASPVVPCCCAQCCYCCFNPTRDVVQISNPDEWFIKMLSTGTSPKCPPHLQGIWWMQDNIAHEELGTFHDGEWATERLGLKSLAFNWTRASTCFGAILHTFVAWNKNTIRCEISPDGRWLNLAGSSGDPVWIYKIQPDDRFALPGGGELKTGPGEMMRLSFKDQMDTNSELTFQYRVRRVAYLDEAGSLVKTEAYDELAALVALPQRPQGCCCGYCLCNLSEEQRAWRNFPMMNDEVVVKYAPPRPGACVPARAWD